MAMDTPASFADRLGISEEELRRLEDLAFEEDLADEAPPASKGEIEIPPAIKPEEPPTPKAEEPPAPPAPTAPPVVPDEPRPARKTVTLPESKIAALRESRRIEREKSERLEQQLEAVLIAAKSQGVDIDPATLDTLKQATESLGTEVSPAAAALISRLSADVEKLKQQVPAQKDEFDDLVVGDLDAPSSPAPIAEALAYAPELKSLVDTAMKVKNSTAASEADKKSAQRTLDRIFALDQLVATEEGFDGESVADLAKRFKEVHRRIAAPKAQDTPGPKVPDTLSGTSAADVTAPKGELVDQIGEMFAAGKMAEAYKLIDSLSPEDAHQLSRQIGIWSD